MPQMAPMNWLALMFFFSMIFIMFNIMNYFSFYYNTKTSSKKQKKTSYSWKW
uniref:ATP synthase complex subunit 8 n=1 Tax=Cerambycidae sp. 1 KM-2017 TaxID=2219286 RepID=A0A346RJG6_9CUCU|nr:ATP synthase F0 subunit 8 [Cerambycidae sp. 1 KM-2017]